MIATVAEVAAGGLVGAPARFVVDQWTNTRTGGRFPWGTFLINATGAFAFGLLSGLVRHHAAGPVALALLGTGFCGAYTTFSTFSYETLRLFEERDVLAGLGNVFGSLVVGLSAAAAGLGLASLT